MSLTSTLVGVAVAATITVTQLDTLQGTLDWAIAALEDVRASEQVRQQQIQDTVCEMNGTLPADCPRIVLKQTVITDPTIP